LINEVKHAGNQRVRILEEKVNASMGNQFEEMQQKIDDLLVKISDNKGAIEDNIADIEKLRVESDDCLCKKIE
jgi:hypothetical protein